MTILKGLVMLQSQFDAATSSGSLENVVTKLLTYSKGSKRAWPEHSEN